MKLQYFDIEFIVDLLKEQEPNRIELIEQLRKTDSNKWIKQAYIQFVSPKLANEPSSDWQFYESIALEHNIEGPIVIDVLKNGRIGGIEFINLIEH